MNPILTAIPAHLWDDSEIPAVAAADLEAGLGLWLARERQGLTLVGAEPPATQRSIDKAIIAMFDHPSRGLAVLHRVRALSEAMAARRLRHLSRCENSGSLAGLVEIAAGMRLNARFGFSANKLVWALATVGGKAGVEREAA